MGRKKTRTGKEQKPKELSPKPKKYLTSEDAKKKLLVLEKQINELQHTNVVVKNKLINFLNKRAPDEFTNKLYANGITFNPNSILVHSNTLNELSQEFETLKEVYINLLRKELITGFISENPESKSDLKDIVIERTASGSHARIILK